MYKIRSTPNESGYSCQLLGCYDFSMNQLSVKPKTFYFLLQLLDEIRLPGGVLYSIRFRRFHKSPKRNTMAGSYHTPCLRVAQGRYRPQAPTGAAPYVVDRAEHPLKLVHDEVGQIVVVAWSSRTARGRCVVPSANG